MNADYEALVKSLMERYQRLVDGYPPEIQGDYGDGVLAGYRLCMARVLVFAKEEENT